VKNITVLIVKKTAVINKKESRLVKVVVLLSKKGGDALLNILYINVSLIYMK